MQQNKHFTHVTMHRFKKNAGSSKPGQHLWECGHVGCVLLLPGIKAEGSLSIVHKWTLSFGCWGLIVGVSLRNKCKTAFKITIRIKYLTAWSTWERTQKFQAERFTLLLFCFSSDSSLPSGRLALRVGWMHTTLLSQEGGPTGGSLSSWSSENSSFPSSARRGVKDFVG